MSSNTTFSLVEVFHTTVNSFNIVELATFGSLLGVSILIGIYYGCIKGNQNTFTEYMLGGKEMHVFPIAMSLITSHCSGITILGYPSETYEFGAQFMVTVLGTLLIVYITNTFYLPVFYSLQLYSVYEYLELRFSKTVRKMCSLIFTLALFLFVPVIIYLPALAFQQGPHLYIFWLIRAVTGISLHYMTPVVCFACIFYTTIGGLKAVVWTDAIQGIFTLTAVVAIIIIGVFKVGGIQRILELNYQGGRLEFFNLDPNPFSRNTFWQVLLGSTCMWITALTIHPGSTQRFVALPTMKSAKRSVIGFGLGVSVLMFLSCVIGLIMYAHYADCDPYKANIVNKTAQVLPYYVKEIGVSFPGLTGLFLSGLTSSALSTMSAAINTVSGTLYEDFVQNWMPKGTTEATSSFVMKVFVFVFGIMCVLLVYAVEKLGEIIEVAYSVGGAPNGTIFGVFALGLFFPWANSKGAFWGMIGSLVFNTWLIYGTQLARLDHQMTYVGKPMSTKGCVGNATTFRPDKVLTGFKQIGGATFISNEINPLYAVSYMYYTPIGGIVCIIIGLLVSFLTGATDLNTLNPNYIAPGVRNFLPKSKTNVECDIPGGYKTVNLEQLKLKTSEEM